MSKPILHGAIEESPRGQVRVYNADGKLLVGTTCRGYLAEVAVMLEEAKAEAWQQGFATGKSRAMRHMSDELNLPLTAPNPYHRTT
jgi:hypothetical protein